MTEIHYNRAPILEAIIDIQVRFSSPPSQAKFAEMAVQIADRFPQRISMRQVGFTTAIGPQMIPVIPMPNVEMSGLRLSTASNDRVLLVQPRGFSFSHMPPYTEWKTFRDEALDLWNRFVQVLMPTAVTRTALRFINRFEIPHERFELDEYFNFRPEIPGKGIPQVISAFFTQCQMQQPDLGSDVTAIMNLASGSKTPQGAQQILLDFDVVATRQLTPKPEDVLDLLNRLRTRKNELFEACITDRARELIK